MASIRNGTRQDITDSGCPLHDAGLYRFSSVAEPSDTWSREEQVTFYRRHGYLVLHDILRNYAVVKDLLDAVDRLASGRNERFTQHVRETVARNEPPDYTRGESVPYVQYEAGTRVDRAMAPELADKVRKLMGFVGYEPTIDLVVQESSPLTSLIGLLLETGGANPELLQDMAMLKYPGGREKPWHQDKAFFDLPEETRVLGCWIALDPATADNGCMRIWSGEFQPHWHFPVRDYQICDSDILQASDAIVGIELPPGGVVLFDGMIPHGTPTNTSQHKRRAMQFHWVAQGTENVSAELRSERFGGERNGRSC